MLEGRQYVSKKENEKDLSLFKFNQAKQGRQAGTANVGKTLRRYNYYSLL